MKKLQMPSKKIVIIKANSKERPVVEMVDDIVDYETIKSFVPYDLIDIVHKKIGEHWYDIIIDDSGRLSPDAYISALGDENVIGENLVGDLIVTKSDDEGHTLGLTEAEAKEVLDHVKTAAIDYSMENDLSGGKIHLVEGTKILEYHAEG